MFMQVYTSEFRIYMIVWVSLTSCSRFYVSGLDQRLLCSCYGAIHKVHHAIFGQFLPPPPCHTSSHIPGPPPQVRHTSRIPIFRRPSTKNPDKSPLVQILSQLLTGFLSGGFCQEVFCLEGFIRGWLLSISVMSEYICYIRKLNITLNFMFHKCGKKSINVMSHALYPLPLSQTVTPSRTPSPLERDVLYGRPPTSSCFKGTGHNIATTNFCFKATGHNIAIVYKSDIFHTTNIIPTIGSVCKDKMCTGYCCNCSGRLCPPVVWCRNFHTHNTEA